MGRTASHGTKIGTSGWGTFRAVLGPGDLDGDGYADLVAMATNGDLWLYPGSGAGLINSPAKRLIYQGWTTTTSLVGNGDLDGDTLTDLVEVRNDGSLFLHRGNGTGTFTPATKGIGNGWATFDSVVSPGDFDQDLDADLLAIGDGTVTLYNGDGLGGFERWSPVVDTNWPEYKWVLGPGDFDNSDLLNVPDLLAVTTTGTMYLYRGDDFGGYEPRKLVGSGFGSSFKDLLSPGDFNGDGKADILAIGTNGFLYMYRGNGVGGWITGIGEKIGQGWGTFEDVIGPRDFSGDGHPDLLTISTDGTMRLYRHTPAGFVSPYPILGTGWADYREVLTPGDFDGDRLSDLIALTERGDLVLFRGNGSGGFTTGVAFSPAQ